MLELKHTPVVVFCRIKFIGFDVGVARGADKREARNSGSVGNGLPGSPSKVAIKLIKSLNIPTFQ